MQRRPLLAKLCLGAFAARLLLGDPGPLLGLFGAAGARLGLLAVLRNGPLATAPELLLARSDPGALSHARHHHQQAQNNSDNHNDDHHDR